MNWEAITAVSELIGAIGVIASLLYLAVQIKADSKARRAATVHDQSEAYRTLLGMIATDSELAKIYYQGIIDFGSLEDFELVRFTSLLGHMFRVFEEAYFQWIEGHLDARVWNGFEGPITDIVAYSGVQAWWSTRSHWYGPEFQEFVQSKLTEAGDANLYGEHDT